MQSSLSSHQPAPRSGKARAHRLAAGFGLLLLLACALWWGRSSLMTWGLQQLLSRTSLSTPKFSGLSMGLGQGRLDEIEFGMSTGPGPVAVELRDVTADYDLGVPKVEAISAAYARLKFTYRPADEPDPSAPAAEQAFPLQRLNIEQLDLDIETPWGPSHFSGRMEIRHEDTGMLKAAFQDGNQAIRIEYEPGDRTLNAVVERHPSGKIFELHGKQPEQHDLHASLDANVAAMLEWLTTTELVPRTLRAKMATTASVLGPDMASLRLKATAEGHANFDDLRGRMMLTRDKAYLASADLKMRDGVADIDAHLDMNAGDVFELVRPWLPPGLNHWQVSRGNVRGEIALIWPLQQEITGTLRLIASDVGLSMGSVTAENGYLELLSQDIARPSLSLSMEASKLRLNKETTLHNVAVKAQVLDHDLTLQRATLPIFGGMLELLPETLNLDRRPLDLTLAIHDIDLSRLLESLNYPALSGSGRISGKLPLRLDVDTIEVQGGALKGTRPGVLQYLGPAAGNENIAFKALRNLRYHSLQAEVNYHPDGDYKLGLRLEGSNPEVLSGHPLAFNLNINGQLPDLLKHSMLSGNFDQSILDQATSKPENGQ